MEMNKLLDIIIIIGLIFYVLFIHKNIADLRTEINHQQAIMTEQEFMLTMVWEERKNCIDQLGVFYKP